MKSPTFDELVSGLRRLGVVVNCYEKMLGRPENVIRIVLRGKGEPRYQEGHTFTKDVVAKDVVKAVIVESCLEFILDMEEKELREHGWWGWVEQNRESCLVLLGRKEPQ